MFARTSRLLLRPAWAEDASALATAIASEAIVRDLATTPWPFGVADAQTFLDSPINVALPRFLLLARTSGAPQLVGACSLARQPSGAIELRYWIARPHWNQGFATEAGHQLVEIAATLGHCRLEASYFLNNPASARVLEKLGFKPTGQIMARQSCTHGNEAAARGYQLALCDEDALPVAA